MDQASLQLAHSRVELPLAPGGEYPSQLRLCFPPDLEDFQSGLALFSGSSTSVLSPVSSTWGIQASIRATERGSCLLALSWPIIHLLQPPLKTPDNATPLLIVIDVSPLQAAIPHLCYKQQPEKEEDKRKKMKRRRTGGETGREDEEKAGKVGEERGGGKKEEEKQEEKEEEKAGGEEEKKKMRRRQRNRERRRRKGRKRRRGGEEEEEEKIRRKRRGKRRIK
ncbi:hypothetical protein L345_07889, partial [Ophiophagus hannah]